MAGVYSVRFLLVKATSFVYYVVPNGKVAVLKSMSAVNDSTSSVQGRITLAGISLWYASVPGESNGGRDGLHIVMNAGESLGCAANSPGMFFCASGYLLDKL